MYYAAHNARADLDNGNYGFSNTWEVSRFANRADREAFLDRFGNKRARAVTRKEADRIWRSNYYTVGKPVPRGGLFDPGAYYGSNGTNFWNEANGYDLKHGWL